MEDGQDSTNEKEGRGTTERGRGGRIEFEPHLLMGEE